MEKAQILNPLLYNVIFEHDWNTKNQEIDIYLIRHGFSVANKASINTMKYQQNDNYKSWLDPQYMDCYLDEWGIKQAQFLQTKANTLNIKIVFVSPLRRALQTAHLIFCNHPNKQNIRFIVLPLISESLCQSDDIPRGTITELMAEYNQQDGIYHDFSYFDKCIQKYDTWFIENLQNQEKRDSIKEQLKLLGKNQQPDSAQSVTLNEMIKIYPDTLETWPYIYLRAQKAKQYIKNLLNIENLRKSGNVCLVAHNEIIRGFTNPIVQGFNEKSDLKQFNQKLFDKGQCLDNCEVFEYTYDD